MRNEAGLLVPELQPRQPWQNCSAACILIEHWQGFPKRQSQAAQNSKMAYCETLQTGSRRAQGGSIKQIRMLQSTRRLSIANLEEPLTMMIELLMSKTEEWPSF
jgi:hypothetical protein